ncbi:MAG: toprim domain-containing protein [Sphingobacteriaceae bacterium]|nr:toprim domain-containing protein [Sphingobacteriaceae bacterium]
MINVSPAKLNKAVEVIKSSAGINITQHQIATSIHDKFYRVGTSDNRNGKDGWFKVLYNGCTKFVTVCYGNWVTQFSDKYHININDDVCQPLRTPEARKQLQAQINAKVKADLVKRDKEMSQKRTYYVNQYSNFNPCHSHDYLTRKGISHQQLYQLRLDTRSNPNLLCVPLMNQNGILQGYQSIDTSGKNKIFRGSVGGNFWRYPMTNPCPHVFDHKNSFFILCEGLATGLSAYEAINDHFNVQVYLPIILCAFNVGNLDKVITATKAHKLPYLLLVDNDSNKLRNAGVEEAKKLLETHRDCEIYPVTFSNGDDANDFIMKRGATAFIKLLNQYTRPLINMILREDVRE